MIDWLIDDWLTIEWRMNDGLIGLLKFDDGYIGSHYYSNSSWRN